MREAHGWVGVDEFFNFGIGWVCVDGWGCDAVEAWSVLCGGDDAALWIDGDGGPRALFWRDGVESLDGEAGECLDVLRGGGVVGVAGYVPVGDFFFGFFLCARGGGRNERECDGCCECEDGEER